MNIARILATKGDKVISIGPDETVREALGALARHNIGALIVVNESQVPIGVISERDIVRAAARNEHLFSKAVRKIMTKNVVTGLPQDDLRSVAATMTERRIRHLPVLDGGKLVGLVSIGDVMKARLDQYRGELDTLETQLLADKE